MDFARAVYLNRVVTKNPPHDVHEKFLQLIPSLMPALANNERERRLFSKLASKAHIEHRYSVLAPSANPTELDTEQFYVSGGFPTTARRMKRYEAASVELCVQAVDELLARFPKDQISHLIVTSCTGFFAPGLDLSLQKHFGLRSHLERSIIGFMGCYAAINAMKAAWHTVRSQPKAHVLVVNIELCTLHLQEFSSLEQILGFMQFADGCAASLISAEPHGLRLDSFRCEVNSAHDELIQWHIGDTGFEMYLSPAVPSGIGQSLPQMMPAILSQDELDGIQLWAVHPGGRSILDSVQDKLGLQPSALETSRQILRNYGNMSSATIMYVLKALMESERHGAGLAMAFGPGLTVETMRFQKSPQ